LLYLYVNIVFMFDWKLRHQSSQRTVNQFINTAFLYRLSVRLGVEMTDEDVHLVLLIPNRWAPGRLDGVRQFCKVAQATRTTRQPADEKLADEHDA
jgi:hypothetical protein